MSLEQNIKLNSDQIEATQKLKEFLTSSKKLFLLSGSAGTGKTSVIVEFLASLPNKKIAFSATTNKAVSVLQNMLYGKLVAEGKQKMMENLTFLTIHKLLKIRRQIDLEGNPVFVTTIDDDNPMHLLNSESIYGYDIIVIDEVSMMSMELIDKILKIQDKLPGKVIFVGDSAQLPPINETNSYVFKLKIPSYQLTKIMRNSGNMLSLSDQVRQLVLANGNVTIQKLADNTIKLYRNKNDWLDKYIAQISTMFNKIKSGKLNLDNSQIPIMLTYTNKSCEEINTKIRNVLFNNPSEKFVKGDIVVFNNFYDFASNEKKYYTSQQAYIANVVIDNYHIKTLRPLDIINIRKRITELSKNLDDNKQLSDTSCPICLNKKEDIQLKNTACGHAFCVKCFDAWTSISKTCPLCRFDLSGDKFCVVGDAKLTDMIEGLRKFTSNKYYRVWLLTTLDKNTILVVHDDEMDDYKSDIEIIRQKLLKIKNHIDKHYEHDLNFMNNILTRMWNFYYYQFIDQFADIVYGYAITTHKSQGSTYENVYIEMNNIIDKNPNHKNSHQCLYTAVTRASRKLKIFY